MRSSFQRVYVEKFCTRCGKIEFEGHVFGQWRTRHLQAQHDTREILCDRCSAPPKLPVCKLNPWFFPSPDGEFAVEPSNDC